MSFHVPEKYRLTHPPQAAWLSSSSASGNNGVFFLPRSVAPHGVGLWIIASEDAGWEHVSVSIRHRCPTWEEMCCVKDLFWDDTDWVVQFHPARAEHRSLADTCLHLWRPIGQEFPHPDPLLVAPEPEEISRLKKGVR